jgi:hypothetical protein
VVRDEAWVGWPTFAFAVAGDKRAAVSGRTHKKDSFAARKILPRNGFLYFAQCALLRDLTRRSMLRLDIIEVAARLRASETRMNTRVSPARDGGNASRRFYLTRVRCL